MTKPRDIGSAGIVGRPLVRHPDTDAVIALVLAGKTNTQIERELSVDGKRVGLDAIKKIITRHNVVRPEAVTQAADLVHGLAVVNPKVARPILAAGACWAMLNAGLVLDGTPYPGG